MSGVAVSLWQEPAHIDRELRALLQALPMKQDIESLIQRVEEAHRRNIQEVRAANRSLSDRADTRETSIFSLKWGL